VTASVQEKDSTLPHIFTGDMLVTFDIIAAGTLTLLGRDALLPHHGSQDPTIFGRLLSHKTNGAVINFRAALCAPVAPCAHPAASSQASTVYAARFAYVVLACASVLSFGRGDRISSMVDVPSLSHLPKSLSSGVRMDSTQAAPPGPRRHCGRT